MENEVLTLKEKIDQLADSITDDPIIEREVRRALTILVYDACSKQAKLCADTFAAKAMKGEVNMLKLVDAITFAPTAYSMDGIIDLRNHERRETGKMPELIVALKAL